MEETHMTEASKIEKLIFILAIAFCWAYKTGELRTRQVAIDVKTHGRKAKSIFRIGLDTIRGTLLKIHKRLEQFLLLLLCFTRTKSGRRIVWN